MIIMATDVHFYTDASAKFNLGCGGIFGSKWYYLQWEKGYIAKYKPSIEYFELYAACTGLYAWAKDLANQQILIYCDNLSVVSMVNQTSSSCRNCMILIRKLVTLCLRFNIRVFAKHMSGIRNRISDSLNRLQFTRFKRITKARGLEMEPFPTRIPSELWPASRIWRSD